MSRFLESIKVKNSNFFNVEYHQQRIDRTKEKIGGKPIKLVNELKKIILPIDSKTYKLRFIYDESSDYEINLEPYTLKNVKSLKAINIHDLEYNFKYFNRKKLEKLYSKKGKCDDIMMVKDGLITDSYYANLAFYDTDYGWVTPKAPLLNGTKREKYVKEGIIKTADIEIEFIRNYSKVCLINALIDLGEIEVDINNIVI